jgi:tetratricopeptide (TPR) repeat protein
MTWPNFWDAPLLYAEEKESFTCILTAFGRRVILSWMEGQRLLAEGVGAFHAGQRERARALFMRLVELDERNELAWLWLGEVVDDVEEREICLENALTINPDNAAARRNLEALRCQVPEATLRLVPAALWPVGAFWLGIAVIFTGAGLAGLWQLWAARDALWLLLTGRGLGALTSFAFLAAGLISVLIAVQVLLRRLTGFYGSLLFALVLLTIAPACSLLREPPDYLGGAMVAFLPSLVFLLTLLSQRGFACAGTGER